MLNHSPAVTSTAINTPRHVEQWSQLVPIADYLLHFGLTPNITIDIKQQLLSMWQYKHALLLGCSEGEILAVLQQDDSAQWVGIDYAEAMLNLTKNNITVAADAAQLPFQNSSVDLIIIATGILDHINNQAAVKILSQCYQVCQSHGRLLVCHHQYPLDLLNQLRWLGAYKRHIIHQRTLNRWFRLASVVRKSWNSVADKIPLINLGKDLHNLCEQRQLDFKRVISCLPEQHHIHSATDINALIQEAGWELVGLNVEYDNLLILGGKK